jgi:RNA polymerase sigma-70 factor (ECF subfamily)
MPFEAEGPTPPGPPNTPRAPTEADREWLRASVRRYERPLVAYAAHLTGGLESARDVVQETFVRLCAAQRADVEPRLAAWLFAVTRNGAIDHRRKQRRMRLVEDDEPFAGLVAGQNPPDLAAERGDSLSAILDTLSTLPPVQQEAVRLKFQHGLSYKEIAAVLNLTATNVGFILHTALKAVRSRLDDENEARAHA